jgi:hypothetical protein
LAPVFDAIAIGCVATIISFVAMVLLAILVVYLCYGTLESDYNSSPDNTIWVVIASPLLLLVSVIFGCVVGHRMKLPSRSQKTKQATAHFKTGH